VDASSDIIVFGLVLYESCAAQTVSTAHHRGYRRCDGFDDPVVPDYSGVVLSSTRARSVKYPLVMLPGTGIPDGVPLTGYAGMEVRGGVLPPPQAVVLVVAAANDIVVSSPSTS
jgi:hypothetical protein